ncbi:MAG: ferredoxin family protein [Fuerstiella sp.]|nr:ferredoxin family protein [Fuerstiella sp.]
MSDSQLSVVICQAQGRHPVRRALEHEITETLIREPGVHVTMVPHLYDMAQNHSGLEFLRSVPGTLIVLGWLYERASRWTLDRAGIRGVVGETLLKADEDQEDESSESPEFSGIGSVDVPDRQLFCIDLRASEDCQDFVEEIRRIKSECDRQPFDLMRWIEGTPKPDQLQRYLQPVEMLAAVQSQDAGDTTVNRDLLPEDTRRRWYPVIDYSRCTNCMECIDFCLFGVYGIDALDRILVEEQDNCKKGCPACSRVCPEHAIVFPQHKTPAIAGADGDVAGVKIDLSRLFGGETGLSAVDQAVRERDAELILDGRQAVGTSVGLKNREHDEFDDLMNEFDALEF